ncbi:hypothetical protein C1645_792905, partial [Glomus cerebriforme]
MNLNYIILQFKIIRIYVFVGVSLLWIWISDLFFKIEIYLKIQESLFSPFSH